MISIRQKNYNRSPKRLLCDAAKRQIRRAADNRNGDICSGNYYRDNTVVALLKAYSLHKRKLRKCDEPKCYYCESKGEQMLVLEVEHFRPKGAVDSIDLLPGRHHSGYYWLGNEWSNLLLSCKACNGRDAKGVRFPITGNRVDHDQPVSPTLVLNRTLCKYDSRRLSVEQPILINPEFDIPEDHLTFTDKGQIKPRNNSIRGKKTIEILNLKRGQLYSARQKMLNDVNNDIKVLTEARDTGRFTTDLDLQTALGPLCRKIIKGIEPCQRYSLWGNYINTNRERLIIANIPTAYQQVFRNAYNYYLANPY